MAGYFRHDIMNLPDKELVGKRFFKNKETYKEQALVQKKVSKELSRELCNHTKEFQNILEIGCGVGFLTDYLLSNCSIGKYFVNDIVPNMHTDITHVFEKNSFDWYEFISGDAEKIQIPSNLNAVASSSTFQWFHDLPSFFVKTYEALQKNGIFAFSTFGQNNFIEVRKITGHGLRYLTLAQLRALLQPYFTIEYAQEWTEKIMFDSPMEVLKHIQATGVNSTSNEFFGKEHLQNFTKMYNRLYNENFQVHLTYHPIIIIAKKK